MQKITKSVAETKKFAETLAKKCRGGEIYALIGTLGSGKTAFTQGFARGLGIRRHIPSPTFTLLNLYPIARRGRLAYFCHVDLYRLRHITELSEIGLSEWLGRADTVTVIEWADRMSQSLRHASHISIQFRVRSESSRTLLLQRHHARA
ncbi:MAG: tRNA (adenosine(37)-N6)-threonylcarbamoyltransferase complex ATPase subunit type 1 TsaE [Candidatus Kerfeldbacteria bacterium]|nr:tRNA (adenosine(37)-N6)-threonylcarbamoyltransferase complex ATPase subunit type 1 TsaE [Candidatus Kerfeldbacteria bacterium]